MGTFVTSSSFLKDAPHNASVSHGNSNEFDLSNDSIANVSHANSNEFDISSGDSDYVYHDNGDHCSGVSNQNGYTRHEINISVLLITCAS